MATKDRSLGSNILTYPASFLPNTLHIRRNILSGIETDSSGDVMQMVKVDAGMLVIAAGLKVITPEGATLTVDLGDGLGTQRYLAGADCNATAGTIYSSNATFLYTAADTVDMILNNNIATAKISNHLACVALFI